MIEASTSEPPCQEANQPAVTSDIQRQTVRPVAKERSGSKCGLQKFLFSVLNSSHFVLIPRAGRRIRVHVRHTRKRAKSIENVIYSTRRHEKSAGPNNPRCVYL